MAHTYMHISRKVLLMQEFVLSKLYCYCATGAMVDQYFPSLFQLFSLLFLGENGKDSDS